MADAPLPTESRLGSPGRASQAALLAGFAAAMGELVPVLLVQILLQNPIVRVFQAIASGLLGRAAYAGGLETAALGALLHLGISMGAAHIFVFAALRWRSLIDQPILSGLGFGVLVWFVMSYLVVPLSAAPFPPASGVGMIAMSILIHMLAFGVPIAFVSRWQLSLVDDFG